MSICNCGSCTSSTCPRFQVTQPSPNNTSMSSPSDRKIKNQKTKKQDTFVLPFFNFVALFLELVMRWFCIGWLHISDLKNQTAELSSSNTTVSTCEVPDQHELVAARRELYGEGSHVYDITHRFQPDLLSWEKKFYRNFDVGLDADTLDLATLNGPALLVDVPRHTNITAKVMMSLNIPKGVKRVLFRTLNTARHLMWKREFDKSYVGFMKDGAKWLVDNTDIKLVGIDYLSAAAYDELYTAHDAFLEDREIIVIGGLKLDNIDAGEYNVHCLPLKLVLAGSPMRCILMK